MYDSSLMDDIFGGQNSIEDSMSSIFWDNAEVFQVRERSMTLTVREERKLIREYIKIISDEE